MDECEKTDKLSSARGRERESYFYIFFHLFALNADVCAVLLYIREYARARIQQTNR